MKQLSEVSETALITLRSRAIESQKVNPLLHDPVVEELFQKLMAALPGDQHRQVLKRKFSPLLSSHIAIRARKFDFLSREFLQEYPEGLIVSPGAGFDTRFWRLGGKDLKYMELESYHPGIKVAGDWSYFEDPDVRPSFLKLFSYSRALSRTQYSLIANIH